jgi:putative endonuclease
MPYYVYIASNWNNKVLYTGVTRDVIKRMEEHKIRAVSGFAEKYNVNKLLYVQEFESILEAITSEKKIKGWKRYKKIELIKSINPEFKDLIG